MMFPIKGGTFSSVSKKIKKHELIPFISVERVCIRSCGEDEESDILTTQEPPGLDYNVKVKIIDLGENFQVPKHGTIQYEELTNSIDENFQPLFKKIPGYKRLIIEDIKE